MSSPTTTDSPAVLPVGDWLLDTTASDVSFTTRAMLGLMGVKGHFGRYEGGLHVGDSGQTSGTVSFDVATIDTGIAKRDTHLRTDDFFGADQYPKVTFTLASVQTGADGRATITGALRVREIDIPITATGATITADADAIRVGAEFPVDHGAAGLGWSKPGMVRKSVQAHVALVFTRA